MSPAIAYPESISVEMSVDALANGYTIATPASTYWQTLTNSDLVDLELGFAGLDGTEYLLGLIRNGIIDRREMRRVRGSSVVNIAGRDRGGTLLDQVYEKIYLPPTLTSTIIAGIVVPVQTDVITIVNGFYDARLPGSTLAHLIPVSRETSAKEIAEDLCSQVGLAAAWQCRDYTLRKQFSAIGPISNALQQLIAPWQDVEAFKVEMTVQSTIVFFRERQLTYDPDYTIALPDASILNLTLEKTRGPVYGRVTLTGMAVSTTLPNSSVSFGGSIPAPGEVNRTPFSRQIFDGDGQLLSTITRTEVMLMPDGVLLRVVEKEVDGRTGQTVKEDTRLNSWTPGVYDFSGGLVNQPLQQAQVATTKTRNKLSGILELTRRESTGYQYDPVTLYLDAVSTRLKTLIGTELADTEMKTVTYKDKGRDTVEVTTTIYKRSRATGALTLSSNETQSVNGPRPGGIKPPPPFVIGGNNAGLNPAVKEEVISSDPRAITVTTHNEHMSPADLSFKMDRFRSASGKFRNILSWQGLMIPQLQTGTVVLFTGLKDVYGVPVSLYPARVIEASIEAKRGEMLGNYRALFWTDS